MTGAQLADHLLLETGSARDFLKAIPKNSSPGWLTLDRPYGGDEDSPGVQAKFRVGFAVDDRGLLLAPPDLHRLASDNISEGDLANLSSEIIYSLMFGRYHPQLNPFDGDATIPVGDEEEEYGVYWEFDAPDDIKTWITNLRRKNRTPEEDRAIASRYVPTILPKLP